MMSKAEKRIRPRAAVRATLGSIETKLADQVQARELWLERERLELRSLRGRYAAIHIELEAERERYGELFDFAPIGYLTLDGAGIIQSANLAAAQLLDTERGRLIGMPLLTKIVTSDRRRLLDHLRHCRNSFGPSTVDLEIARRDGHTTPAQLL